MSKKHLFTIDTEDWFQVYYLSQKIPTSTWPHQLSLIDPMIDKTLELLNTLNIKATFFIVGWSAKRSPRAIRKIHKQGHEIASHGYWHQPYYSLTEKQIRTDLQDAKKAIEDAIGEKVAGFRAPGFSITKKMIHVLNWIEDSGHTYDSSILDSAKNIYKHGKILEIPPNTFFNLSIPTGGGFFLRMLPYTLFKLCLNAIHRNDRHLNFYTHTWEIDGRYERRNLGLMKNIVQYYGISSMEGKIHALARDYKFTTIRDYITEQRNLSGSF